MQYYVQGERNGLNTDVNLHSKFSRCICPIMYCAVSNSHLPKFHFQVFGDYQSKHYLE